MSELIKAALGGMATGLGMRVALGLPSLPPLPAKTKDEKILEENKEEFLKYYYDVIIQGQAP